MNEQIRSYERDVDFDAVARIWREVDWIDSDEHVEPLRRFLDVGNVEVAVADDSAECAVVWHPGSIHYQETDLSLCAVTAVTTGLLGRKRGWATTLTARAVAQAAESGLAVAALGMFEQGFYDRVGFGTAAYNHRVSFNPRELAVDHVPYRTPVRLSADDHVEVHAALAGRHRTHGSVVLDSPEILNAEMRWIENPFGLGYRNDDGRLTHFVYGRTTDERGRFQVSIIGYETPTQLLELLRLLREMGDQVMTVTMDEPAELQLQDLVGAPMRDRVRTASSAFKTGIDSLAWLQLRILDLDACVAARSWPGPEIAFNLTVRDPAPSLIDTGWVGVDGDFTITVGESSSVEAGHRQGLATLNASIGAFSRCWFAVRSVSSLAITDDLDGPAELFTALDDALRQPPPRPGWDF